MAESIRVESGELETDRVSDFHVADLTASRVIHSREHICSLLSSRLSFLASGYGDFPSGLCFLVTFAASMRRGLVQSPARLDRGSTAPEPLTTHPLIAPSFGPH